MLALYVSVLFVNALAKVGNCGVLDLHLVSGVVMAKSLIHIAIPLTSSCSFNLAPLLSPPYMPKTNLEILISKMTTALMQRSTVNTWLWWNR